MAKNNDQLLLLTQYLENAQTNINLAHQILSELSPDDIPETIKNKAKTVAKEDLTKNTKVVEGVFDGQNMVGPDGKIYTIAPNYASKSKLVEGDILKLTIMPDGSFVYKQIGPVDRQRLVGQLSKDEETKEFRVLANGRSYKVIMASVTYYKGDTGDEAVILVPKDQDSRWAAIENIVSDKQLTTGAEGELASGNDWELSSGLDMELKEK
ncbi:MAG: hypothetical protein WC752_03640 [Patescibacteria group bacterium]|jgi:hypothetical protein